MPDDQPAKKTARLKIRAAEASDSAIIFELINCLAEFEKLSHQVATSADALRTSLFEGERVAHVLLAELDGVAAGFALYFYNFSTFLGCKGIYLEDLYVRENVRSHGIGLELLRALAVRADSEGCGRLEWSVLDWNKRAIDFYERLGAKPQNEWTVYRLDRAGISTLASGLKF